MVITLCVVILLLVWFVAAFITMFAMLGTEKAKGRELWVKLLMAPLFLFAAFRRP